MADRAIGMDPMAVSEQSRVISGHTATLTELADEVARTGEASRWPGVFGLFPGNLILTKGSIFLAENAASDVRLAAEAAHELIGRLGVNVSEQIAASSAGDGYADGQMSKRQADELYERVMRDPHALDDMSPEQVAQWWSTLSKTQQDAFVSEQHWVAGNTNGIPFDRRAQANQLNAEEMLLSGTPLSDAQREYLEQVAGLHVNADGEVVRDAPTKNLISFDPAADRIIEMIGELGPETTNIVEYVPGTASTMNDFYTEGTQGMGNALVDGANPPGSTVVFVYKDSPFPGWDATTGVYHSSSASSAGGPYHDFNTALAMENTDGASVTSIEHSYGSSVGGYAETQGTHFDNRIVLGGIGMTDDWTPDPDTNYYSYTGPDDIIRLAREKGSEETNTGYEMTPTAENGFIELDTGYDDIPSPTFIWDVPGYVEDAADQHRRVGGVDDNQVVVGGIIEILNG